LRKTNSIKIIECFHITGRGLLTEIQHSENGIPPNTKLINSESGDSWTVKKRVLSDNLMIVDSEAFFDCETEFESISQSYKTETDRQLAVGKELNRRKEGIYWYVLVPENSNQQTKPKIGSLLKIKMFYFEKSTNKIKEQLEFWFLKYFAKDRSEINGKELFTLFDLLDRALKDDLTKRLNLREDELPVLFLKTSDNCYIINTTERFIRLTEYQLDYIEYVNFERHSGYDNFIVKKRLIGKPINVKAQGYYSDFGIKTKTGELIQWEIPTGTPGFGFWNVTKKCELIGRKYLKNKTIQNIK